MIRKIFILIAISVIILSNTSCKRSVKHVVLISLDGSRPEFYMDTSWHAPHLQKLKMKAFMLLTVSKAFFLL